MNLRSSFCFGVLFLLKASIALSAPHSSYPDEDEEALIDKLASLAAAVGPDSNFDLAASYLAAAGIPPGGAGGPSPVDFSGNAEEALIAREAALKLPREFGYKPNDIRFFLPADQFPILPQNNVALPPQQYQPPLQQGYPAPRVPVKVPEGERVGAQGQGEFILGEDKSDFYFMKKKEQITEGRASRGGGGMYNTSPGRSFVPGPSNIMASEHSATNPGYIATQMQDKPFSYSDMYYIAIVAGCSAAAVVGIIAAGICYYRVHERIKAAADVDYPAYGVTGPSKDLTPGSGRGDQKLAQSAQMYHYQHQKQQMAALQKGAIQGDRQGSGGSDVESDDDNEDGDYTVYECPGLAPAGEMEVKNPLFNDDQPTPATPSNGAKQSQQAPPAQQPSQDSESASSSASSTATVTSSTPKITESPNTPPPTTKEPAPAPPKPTPAERKEKGKAEKK